MLKSCVLSANYNNSNNKTCGEIICENQNEFIINCKLCKLKIFEFEEFIQHFKNIHLVDTSKPQKSKLENASKYVNNQSLEATEEKEKQMFIKNEKCEKEFDDILWKEDDSNDCLNNDSYEHSESDEDEEVNEEESNIIMKKVPLMYMHIYF